MTRGIILNTTEVRAVQGGATMIVRPLQPQPCFVTKDGAPYQPKTITIINKDGHLEDIDREPESGKRIVKPIRCPFGKPGDTLYVRETFFCVTDNCYTYRADDDLPEFKGLWCPASQMPKEASRLSLEIVNVTVGRVQYIAEEEAIASGVEKIHVGTDREAWKDYYPQQITKNLAEIGVKIRTSENTYGCYGPIESFRSLWDSRYSKRGLGWDVNPWAWFVDVKRIGGEI